MHIHDLMAAAEKVADEKAFIQLLHLMRDSWMDERDKELIKPSEPYSAGANGWENGSIGDFLDASAAWAEAISPEDSDGSSVSETWRRAARILVAGAFYE